MNNERGKQAVSTETSQYMRQSNPGDIIVGGEGVFEKMKQPNKQAKEMLRYFTEEEISVDSKREKGRCILLVVRKNGN